MFQKTAILLHLTMLSTNFESWYILKCHKERTVGSHYHYGINYWHVFKLTVAPYTVHDTNVYQSSSYILDFSAEVDSQITAEKHTFSLFHRAV